MAFKKIGIDFHGVVSKAPDLFKQLAVKAIEQGSEVYIISGGPRAYIETYLNRLEFPYHKLWCIIDEPEVNEKTQFFADGSFRVNDELWDGAKAKYCRAENIDLQIDDSVVYGKYFVTPYCRFDAKMQKFYCANSVISANQDIGTILSELETVAPTLFPK